MRSPLATLFNKAPVPYIGRGGVSIPWRTPTGAEAQMRAMGSVGTLFAIVHRLSNATAQAEWGLYKQARPGEDPDEREPVTRHLALDLWNRPNPFYSRQEFVETFEQHVELTGEGWWIIARNKRAKLPLELWPVRPDRMAPIPDPDEFLTGYTYTTPDGTQIDLEVDEVIQLKMPNPLDPYRGMGPVQTLLTDLDATKYSAEWNRNFFLNSAEPGGIIQVEKRLSDSEFDEMTTRWGEQHKGVANAHRVAIIEQGQWIDRKYTNRDMQFTELRQLASETIREAFGFPKPMLGTVEDVNRANAEAAEVVFARWLIVERLERIKQVLNTRFLSLFGASGSGLEFDYASPVPEDREADNAELLAKAEAASLLVTAGYGAAATLETVGLPDMPWTAPVVPHPPPPHNPPPPPAARLDVHHHEHALQAAAQPAGRSMFDLARPRPALTAAVDADPGDLPDITPVQESWLAALEALLSHWATVFGEWVDALIDQIRSLIGAGNRAGLGGVQVPEHNIDVAREVIKAAMVRLAHQAARQVVHEADGQDVDLEAGTVDEDALREVADVVARNLAREAEVAASREALRRSTPDSAGDTEADRVASGVRQYLEHDDQADAQPRQWLGNALTQAQHAGRVATFTDAEQVGEAPVPAYYASEKNDGSTCKFCREVNGRWLGNSIAAVEAEYPSGGYVRCLGRERCRGEVVAVWRPEQTGGGR